MPSTDKKVRVYEELAEWEHKQGSPQARDRFLILAADAALTAGLTDEAERFRSRLLEYNPHHLLRPYASMADAMKSSDVHGYIADLRNSFPPEDADRILAALQSGGRPPDKTPPSEPPTSSSDTAPTVLPDPPPLEAFRFKQDEPAVERSAAGALEGPADSPPAFAGLREPASAPLPHRRKTVAPRLPARPLGEGPQPSVEDDVEELPTGISMWLSDAMFVLVLVAGVALLGYTLARPFLNLPDSPLR